MRPDRFKKLIFSAVFLVLALSILLNVGLYSQLRKYYTLLYAVELDPLGLSSFQDVSNQQKPDETLQTVVFFGDSRAVLWPAPNMEGFWFINRGIGNQTSAQIANRVDEHITPLQPDVVLLQFCVNDLKTIPLFPERRQQIIFNCESNLQNVVQELLNLDSIVVISTIFPTGQVPLARRLVWSDEINESIEVVNNFIRDLSADRVLIFDAASLLSDDKGRLKHEYSFDELHLNEQGYQVLNIEFIKLLEKIKQGSP